MHIKNDPYCSIDKKKEPITNKILKYLVVTVFIMNLVFIMVFILKQEHMTVYFKATQKTLEENYAWTGMLIESSPKYLNNYKITDQTT
jgi:hypothetical protein